MSWDGSRRVAVVTNAADYIDTDGLERRVWGYIIKCAIAGVVSWYKNQDNAHNAGNLVWQHNITAAGPDLVIDFATPLGIGGGMDINVTGAGNQVICRFD